MSYGRFKLHKGRNVDTHAFDPRGCVSGGLHYTSAKHLLH